MEVIRWSFAMIPVGKVVVGDSGSTRGKFHKGDAEGVAGLELRTQVRAARG